MRRIGLPMTGMIGILVFINWSSSQGASRMWDLIHSVRYVAAGAFDTLLVYTLWRWYDRSELRDWVRATRDFAVQILRLLFAGVLVAGFLLGRPGQTALIPSGWIAGLVGGKTIGASLVASSVGALMYFATLTEVPIMQGLMGAGMGQGPALALLPVVVLSTMEGLAYGTLVGG